MAMLEHNNEWLEHHGKTVMIEGKEHKINVSVFNAVYPFEHKAIMVYAERGQYGYDLLECSDDLFLSIDQQLGGIYKD